VLRTVTFENLKISKIDFPTLPGRGANYSAALQSEFSKAGRTMSLDRLETSLALGGIKPPTLRIRRSAAVDGLATEIPSTMTTTARVV